MVPPMTEGSRRPRIGVLDDYLRQSQALADWSTLAEMAEIVVIDRPLRGDEAASALADFDILCTLRERQPFPATLLNSLPRLRYLCVTGKRYDSVDVAAATRQGILVSNTPIPGAGSGSVTELTWGLILSVARHIAEEARHMREGGWQRHIGTTLRGKRLGVVGLGGIGRDVAVIGQAFGMEVIAWSPNLTAEKADPLGIRAVTKDELFGASDVVTLHLALGDRTARTVGSVEIGAMKKAAFLVNTARAGLIDEAALVSALETQAIAGAGLDVFSIEPLPDEHVLRRLPNVTLTPHLGYFTREALGSYYSYAIENIHAFLTGNPIRLVAPGKAN
jgi:phosphoglycerate dehydrogenase-like enzyme